MGAILMTLLFTLDADLRWVNWLKLLLMPKIVSKYDQEMPQSQTQTSLFDIARQKSSRIYMGPIFLSHST